MSEAGDVKASCQNCGGNIEYPPEAAGMAVACPHCGLTTALPLQEAEEALRSGPPGEGGKRKAWLILGALLVLLAVAGGVGWLVQRRQPAPATTIGSTPAPAHPPRPLKSSNDLNVASIALERTAGGGLVYATGDAKNNSDYQRFGVKIELELLDGRGAKVGTATDYSPLIEPRGLWHFKALVLEPKTSSARLVNITEEE